MSETQLLGTISTQHGLTSVRVEDYYKATAEELWASITQPERLANWIATVDGELRVGGTFHAVFTSGWEGEGRIQVCDPHHHLQLTMSAGEDSETTVEATLHKEGEWTRLIIEERGLAVAEAPGFAAGWQAHIEDLAATLAGGTRGDWKSRWTELSEPYNEVDAKS